MNKFLKVTAIVTALSALGAVYLDKSKEKSEIDKFCHEFPKLNFDNKLFAKDGVALIKSKEPLYRWNFFRLKEFEITSLLIENTPENRADLKLYTKIAPNLKWPYIKLSEAERNEQSAECTDSTIGIFNSIGIKTKNKCVTITKGTDHDLTGASVIEIITDKKKANSLTFERRTYVIDGKTASNISTYSDGKLANENGGKKIVYCKWSIS